MSPLVKAAVNALLKTAVIYLRVSTIGQVNTAINREGYSLPAQREICTRHAAMLGARVIAEFVEPGKSATSTKRPALQRMLTELGELQPDYVIVFDLSRVARDEFDALWLLREITALGCKLESTQERVDDTAEGMLNYTIMSGVNAFRSRNDGKKVRLGMQRKHLEGGTLGPAPLGYLNVRETIEDRQIASVAIDAQRVPLIRMAFDLAATGQHTIRSITELLEEAGLRSRATPSRPAKPLNIATVHRMLRNDYYLGIVTHGGIKQPGRHEPLIDQDTFDRVQAVLDSHRACGSRGHKHHHYLSGQLRCGTCGKRHGYGRHRGKMGVHYEYYSCLSRVTPSGPCGACYVRLQLIEDHLDTIHANDWLTADEREQVRHAVRKYVGDKAQVARSEGERHARRLRELTTNNRSSSSSTTATPSPKTSCTPNKPASPKSKHKSKSGPRPPRTKSTTSWQHSTKPSCSSIATSVPTTTPANPDAACSTSPSSSTSRSTKNPTT